MVAVSLCRSDGEGERRSCQLPFKKALAPRTTKRKCFCMFDSESEGCFFQQAPGTVPPGRGLGIFLLGNGFCFFCFPVLRCQGKVSGVVALCRANHSGSQRTSSASSHSKTTSAKTTTTGLCSGLSLRRRAGKGKKKKSFK